MINKQKYSPFTTQRLKLIEELKQKGISDVEVLKAIEKTPREEFVKLPLQTNAYLDSAMPIDCNQTISQPYTVAFMTQILEAKSGMKVLEIGTGSGYQAAILCNMGLKVYTVERHLNLLNQAKEVFKKLNLEIFSLHADGTLGWSLLAPFDRIIVTAAAPEIPDTLLKQLATNGVMALPVGNKDKQKMCLVKKIGGENQYDIFDYGEFKFVPLIGKKGWEE